MSEDCHSSDNAVRNPFPHMGSTLDGVYSVCDPDCGACAFNRARAAQQREDLHYPPKALTLTGNDIQFLNDLKITWVI